MRKRGKEKQYETFKKADSKILVVYFSATGTTKPIAEYAAEAVGRICLKSFP